MAKNAQSSRAVAANILSKFDPQKDNLSDLLTADLSANQPAVRNYVYQTLRNIKIIDSVLKTIASVHKDRVEKKVLNSLRVAVYELIYAPQTPDYAIINEAVSNFNNAHKRGFVNAVLRNIRRNIADRQVIGLKTESRFVPTGINTGCEFKLAVAAEPKKDLAAYYSDVFSLSDWLLRRWLSHYGKQHLLEICLGSNRVPFVHLRPNTTLIRAQSLANIFTENGVYFQILESGILAIESFGSSGGIENLPGYEDGFFCVQDETAAKAAQFMAPSQGEVIIDLCAAPGTKTTHLAQLMNGTGKVIATDINSARLQKVRENAKRLRLENIEVVEYEDIFKYAAKFEKIDKVLIDAPCSNTGVLAKRVEARFRITPQSISQLSQLGLDILNTAALRFKHCKEVFYSTCSIENEENTQVLHRFFKANKKVADIKELLTLPKAVNYGCDGGYVAKTAINIVS